MEPVEINAGGWYLRGLRADDRVDDRPALADLGETASDYVQRSAAGWAADTAYCWGVCEPTTGELLAEVLLNPISGELTARARDGHADAAAAAVATVSRFAAGALGLTAVFAGADAAVSADQDPAQPGDSGH